MGGGGVKENEILGHLRMILGCNLIGKKNCISANFMYS